MISHYAASQATERGITVNMLAFGAFTALSGSMEDGERIGAELVSTAVLWLSHRDNQFNGKIFEVAAGRVAENFFGSN